MKVLNKFYIIFIILYKIEFYSYFFLRKINTKIFLREKY